MKSCENDRNRTRKIIGQSELQIPPAFWQRMFWYEGISITAWIDVDKKIFLRETCKGDNRDLKFFVSPLSQKMSWHFPQHWQWFYNFKKGDEFEFDFYDMSKRIITIQPINYVQKPPKKIFKNIQVTGVTVPSQLLAMAKIEPLGGIKIDMVKDHIAIKPEKIDIAKHFINHNNLITIPQKMRKILGFKYGCRVELIFDGEALIIKKADQTFCEMPAVILNKKKIFGASSTTTKS